MRNLNFYIFSLKTLKKGPELLVSGRPERITEGGRRIVILFISKRYHISIKKML